LAVYGQAGADTFNVTPSATTAIFLDGGDPIGTLPGDHINIAGPVTVSPGPQNDEGGLDTAGNLTVSFDHIESISVIGPPGGGGVPAVINGTNGDDDITIIARDQTNYPTASFPGTAADGVQDFTVSVNQGLDIYFQDTAGLIVNALNGDDEVYLQTPAPNP